MKIKQMQTPEFIYKELVREYEANMKLAEKREEKAKDVADSEYCVAHPEALNQFRQDAQYYRGRASAYRDLLDYFKKEDNYGY